MVLKMDVTELHDEENLLVQMQDRWGITVLRTGFLDEPSGKAERPMSMTRLLCKVHQGSSWLRK